MKIIQIAVTEGELFALTDSGHVFRLVSGAPNALNGGFGWQTIPLPVQLPAPEYGDPTSPYPTNGADNES